MRLFGVGMVRNEADIIETSIRHNLTVLDGMVVIDHGSVDRTSEILARLHAEGLPLSVIRDSDPGFFQAERLTTITRHTLTVRSADFVFPIDADEFIKARSRTALEEELADVPDGSHAVMHWLTYVPESFAARGEPFGPSHLRWRLKTERHGSYKCVIGRSFGQRQTQYIVSGNHLVDDAGEPRPPPHMRLRQEIVALAHCPVRSSDQLMRKVTLGFQAHLATQPTNDKQALHWMQLYDELSAGERLPDERLREIACNYGLPRDQWQPADAVDLVEDPVALASKAIYA